MSRSGTWFGIAALLFIIGALCVLDWKYTNFIPYWYRWGCILGVFIGGLGAFSTGINIYRE